MLIPKINLVAHMGYFCLCMTMIIIARLFYLQILNQDFYLRQSTHNYIRYESISTARGEILDCNGHKLVTNRPLTNLYWQGTGCRTLSTTQRELLSHLETIIPAFRYNAHACGTRTRGTHTCDTHTCNAYMLQCIHKAERTNERLLLCANISTKELCRLEELCGSHRNILIQHDTQRYYPHGPAASHIIGYVRGSQHDQIGNMGLEKYLEDTLQGSNGTCIKTINSFGKKIMTHETQPSVSGNTIHTTLDIKLQLLAEKVFADPHEGTFILMDPSNGAIKALVSLPNFDPTVFLTPIDPETWQTLQNKKPFLNKAIHCTYPPGSLFKLVTVSAGLEENLIQAQDTFVCEGSFICGNRTYRCHNKRGHGSISVMQGLARSCNILFYRLGTQLTVDTLADYATRFGLGTPTGFLFPEKTGLVPTAAWKKEMKGEQWWPGETVSAAIGQSYILVTPLQIARMIGSIFTGYLVKPRIDMNEEIETIPIEIKPEILNFLQQSMRSVVTEGTGKQMHAVKEITLYAKTSTAQVVALKPGNRSKEYREHGWVVAYFTCKDHDPLVMVILAEHAGSSRVPMTIAKEFLLEYSKT